MCCCVVCMCNMMVWLLIIGKLCLLCFSRLRISCLCLMCLCLRLVVSSV